MEVLLFVIFWAVLAVALLAMALFGGRRRGKDAPPRRGGRAWWYVAFGATLLVFGAAIPIASGLGAHENTKEIAKAGISDLSPSQERGRELFAKYCILCHSLDASNAVAQVGPNLDDLRPTKELVLDAIHNGRARGNGAMARDLVVGSDAEDVANYVCAAVGQCE
jgi:mono/diheme cytochrome c family protein